MSICYDSSQMGQCFMSLNCDFDDSESVSAMVCQVLENKIDGAKSVFLINSGLPFEVAITSDPSYGFDVQVLDNNSDWAGRIMSVNDHKIHRDLEVKRLVEGVPRGSVGHLLLMVMNKLEGVLGEENVRGYDLIVFYIREGYVPESRACGVELLKNELVHYLESGKPKPNRKNLPITKLRYDPAAAAIYWEELKRLSGYIESEK